LQPDLQNVSPRFCLAIPLTVLSEWVGKRLFQSGPQSCGLTTSQLFHTSECTVVAMQVWVPQAA